MSLFGFLGSALGAATSLFGANKNAKAQKEFAQHGIQWKAEDARKAGLHPLYAMGAQTPSFQPVSYSDAGTHMAQAGQDLSRAMDSTRTAGQRVSAAASSEALTNARLQNELLRTQIMSAKLAVNRAANPAFPSVEQRWLVDGQGQTAISDEPLKRQTTAPSNPSHEAGPIAEMGFLRTPTGYMPVKSRDAMDRMDEDNLGSAIWSLRNRVLPSFGINQNPPDAPLPEGKRWAYHPFWQEYRPHSVYRGPFGIEVLY